MQTRLQPAGSGLLRQDYREKDVAAEEKGDKDYDDSANDEAAEEGHEQGLGGDLGEGAENPNMGMNVAAHKRVLELLQQQREDMQ
jgi:hypothetical protein